MIKVLFTFAVISLLSMSSDSKVYICNSENAVAYHLEKDCRGINACKEDILEVTKEEALEMELRLCKWED